MYMYKECLVAEGCWVREVREGVYHPKEGGKQELEGGRAYGTFMCQ